MRIQNHAVFLSMVSAGILLSSCTKESDPSVSAKDHFEADGWVLFDEGFDEVYHVWRGASQDSIHVHAGCGSPHLQIRFLDSDSNLVNPPEDEDHVLGWVLEDSTLAAITRHDGDEWEFHLQGLREGRTALKLQIMHLDHADASTPWIPIIVEEAVTPCPEESDHNHE